MLKRTIPLVAGIALAISSAFAAQPQIVDFELDLDGVAAVSKAAIDKKLTMKEDRSPFFPDGKMIIVNNGGKPMNNLGADSFVYHFDSTQKLQIVTIRAPKESFDKYAKIMAERMAETEREAPPAKEVFVKFENSSDGDLGFVHLPNRSIFVLVGYMKARHGRIVEEYMDKLSNDRTSASAPAAKTPKGPNAAPVTNRPPESATAPTAPQGK